MKKHELFLLCIIPFLILVIGLSYGQYRRRVQTERNVTMTRFFNHRFASIKYRNGKVVMTPKFIFNAGWDFKTPRTLSRGEKFKFQNRHWQGKFEITNVRPDEVSISYDYNGEIPAHPGYWSGEVKLSTE